MFSFFKREKWRHVKTYSFGALGGKPPGKEGKFYYHLKESSKGNRRCEFSCTFTGYSQNKIDEFGIASEIYQDTIYRWLNGRVDPDIPTYGQVPQEETANVLRGKIK